MNCLVSVIIPVYNVEKYLRECVDSVLIQTYKDIEVILVDDGSTDSSGKLCDEYGERDQRIKIIHQVNGGLSEARNTGIRNASGDYLIFLDSDDFWDDCIALQCLVDRILSTKAEVLNYSYKKYYEMSGKCVRQFSDVLAMPIDYNTKKEQLEYIFSKSLYIASACNKMIAKSVFERGLFFEKGKLSEDIEWCAKLLLKAESFDFVCANFYCYRQREGSITHTIAEKACIDLKDNILRCIRIANMSDIALKDFLYQYTAYQFATFIAVQAIAERCPNGCIKELSNKKWLLKYHANNRKVKIFCYASKILGFSGLCGLVRMTKKIWLKAGQYR